MVFSRSKSCFRVVVLIIVAVNLSSSIVSSSLRLQPKPKHTDARLLVVKTLKSYLTFVGRVLWSPSVY